MAGVSCVALPFMGGPAEDTPEAVKICRCLAGAPMLRSAGLGRYATRVSLCATEGSMLVSRRAFGRMCAAATAGMLATRVHWSPFGWVAGVAAQAVALKDLVPPGWTIGA